MSEHVWKPRASVKLRFALVQGFFIAAIIAVLAFTLYFPVKNYIVTITDSSYKILADNLAASIYTPYTNGVKKSVINAVRQVKGQRGVKFILVIDSNNTVYYDTISGSSSLEGKNYEDELTKKVTKGDIVVGKVEREGITYYNYVSPIIANNELYYTVRLGIDQEVIDGEFNRLGRLFVYMGIFGIILGVLVAYFLAARLTSPIIKLTESALAIRAGNLNAYPDINTNDELEQLSREFQNMVEKLKQFYFQEYSQKKQALEAKKHVEEINARLHELDRQKSDFLNAASHQLRTPLSVIHWSLSLIVEAAPHMNLPPDQLSLLEESLKSTKRMVDLVNDLLDVSRIEQGRKEINWSLGNAAQVCEELVKALQPLAKNKNLTLTFERIGEVPDSYIDPPQFYQLINNFVDNSIKYTAQGFVHVSCQKKDGEIEVRIQDSGIGMTDEERNRLFVTRFNRGSDAAKMFPNGSGLGMYVANTILQQHGGEIHVESVKGQGTTFIITIPFREEPPENVKIAEESETAQMGGLASRLMEEQAEKSGSTEKAEESAEKEEPKGEKAEEKPQKTSHSRTPKEEHE